jgi:hypothetical protein
MCSYCYALCKVKIFDRFFLNSLKTKSEANLKIRWIDCSQIQVLKIRKNTIKTRENSKSSGKEIISNLFDTFKFHEIGWNGAICPNKLSALFSTCLTLQHKIGFLLFVVHPTTRELQPENWWFSLFPRKTDRPPSVISRTGWDSVLQKAASTHDVKNSLWSEMFSKRRGFVSTPHEVVCASSTKWFSVKNS